MRPGFPLLLLVPLLVGCGVDEPGCPCDGWETCVADRCAPLPGRCTATPDCAGDGAWCDADHVCQPAGLCAALGCGPYGACTVAADATVACVCDDGYRGERCTECATGRVALADGRCVPDPCTVPDPCAPHGACAPEPEDGGVACACDEGWGGERCAACAAGWYPAGEECVDRMLFALPLDRADLLLPLIGVDHEPGPGTSDMDCVNYDGDHFPFCYDEHDGTDLLLRGGFPAMDAGSTAVLAAADGEVLETHDGEYDRCRADAATMGVVCGDYGYVTPANYVKLRHADGVETWYWHLARDSVTVAVGDRVSCGEPLGLVGSSGYSTAPHLHFEVVGADGVAIDPFAGPLSQPESCWVEQDAGDRVPGRTCQGR